MITWWKLTILSIVQGVAEFLPISSSGHLVALEDWLNVSKDVSDLNIVLHVGTLLPILLVYRNRIARLLISDRRLVGLVIVGTLPAVAIGLVVKLFFEHWLESPLVAGLCFPLTGLLLFWCDRQTDTSLDCSHLSWKQAIGIGCAQAVAVLPGISRTGSTIAAGLAVGLSRTETATFSFLLAIPVLVGAAMLEAVSVLNGDPLTTPLSMLLVGTVISALVGWFALQGLLKVLKQGRLRWFALWCLALGLVILVQQS